MIEFKNLSPAEQQAFVDFSLKEEFRHWDDIMRGRREREFIKKTYGLTPRDIYVNEWISIEGEGEK
jgi:hypothetical protein